MLSVSMTAQAVYAYERRESVEFKVLAQRAAQIRSRYRQYEMSTYGREWTDEEIALGFVGSGGDLVKLAQAKNGVRVLPDVDQRLAHELADCLWSLDTLADLHEIDLGQAFLQTMDDLGRHLRS
jgi:NTP pyrophosphatase (non-canonical NTP hydrolase)